MRLLHNLTFLNRQFWVVLALVIAAGFFGVSRLTLALVLGTEILMMLCCYSCSHCGKPFDIRTKFSQLTFCPNCGEKVKK